MEIELINIMLEKKVRKSLIETKERKEKLLIESYGVNITTLEEVFLKIT